MNERINDIELELVSLKVDRRLKALEEKLKMTHEILAEKIKNNADIAQANQNKIMEFIEKLTINVDSLIQ